jgi:SecD/SecF fusion protein
MNKTWLILVIAGIVLVGLFILTAAAAFLFFPQIRDSMTHPQGPVLIYEVDPDGLAPGETVDMNKLVQAIDRRVSTEWSRLACVRILDGRRIEVAVVGKSEADVRRVESLLTHCGMLQFRILANRRDNADLIAQALADPSKTKFRDKSGILEAWWVPVKPGQESGMRGPEIAVRQTTKTGRPTTEILVLNDDFNITGAYLTRASAAADSEGRPCIQFAFNSHGGQLFGELTSSHLPDKISGLAYRLAIILDDEVYSAPSIRSTIYDSGEITGSFTKEEVDEVVGVLNAGNLPAKIRPAKK